jgi:hypothetical protein
MLNFLKELRSLRIAMAGTTFFVAICSRFAGGDMQYSGWAMMPTLIVPALVPLLFFILLLDALMTWVFRVDAKGSDRERLGRILMFDIGLVVLLVVSWAGYFIALTE